MATQEPLLKGNCGVERYSVLATQSLPPLPPLQSPKVLEEMLAGEIVAGDIALLCNVHAKRQHYFCLKFSFMTHTDQHKVLCKIN